jgi:hypothetical protein
LHGFIYPKPISTFLPCWWDKYFMSLYVCTVDAGSILYHVRHCHYMRSFVSRMSLCWNR